MIGTQMIAKGLDFPQVPLVGVVAADLALNLPDYRSRERAFQLFTQVAGRAGPGSETGRVIIQTYLPNDPVIKLAANQDYRSFFEAELRRRRNGLYPPFSVLARLLIESNKEEKAERILKELGAQINIILSDHPEWQKKVLHMTLDTPSVKYLKSKHRRHIVIKALVSRETDDFFAVLTDLAGKETPDVQVYLEINPTNMM